MGEADFGRTLMARATKAGARLFRNNVGNGWVGKIKQKSAEFIVLLYPRVLHAGLCTGSSDLIGWTPVVITPEMIGKTVAIFTAIETKVDGRKTTDEQDKFIAAVLRNGGLAGVAYTEDDLDILLKTIPGVDKSDGK